MRTAVVIACLLSVLPLAPALAGKAHEHGAARLDVGVEPQRLLFSLEMPLDSLVGFERAPRTDAERQAADAALGRLRGAAAIFRIDPAAGCTLARADVAAEALKPGAAGTDGHGDVDAEFEFSCRDGFKASFVEIGLFDAFSRLQRLDVQAVTRKGQVKATLKRGASRLPLAR